MEKEKKKPYQKMGKKEQIHGCLCLRNSAKKRMETHTIEEIKMSEDKGENGKYVKQFNEYLDYLRENNVIHGKLYTIVDRLTPSMRLGETLELKLLRLLVMLFASAAIIELIYIINWLI